MSHSTNNVIKPVSISHSVATENALSKYIKSISMMNLHQLASIVLDYAALVILLQWDIK